MIAFLFPLLFLYSCFADECSDEFGEKYINSVDIEGACQHVGECVKCLKGYSEDPVFRFCSMTAAFSWHEFHSLEEVDAACGEEFGDEYYTLIPGTCMLKDACVKCLDGQDILMSEDNKLQCPEPVSSPARRKRRHATHALGFPEYPPPPPPPPRRYSYAPPHLWYHPQRPQQPLYPPPPYGYPRIRQGDILSDEMMYLLANGELGGGSDKTFSRLIAQSQFGGLGGYGGLEGIPATSLALSGIGAFGGLDPALLAFTGAGGYGGIDSSSLALWSMRDNLRNIKF